MLRVEQMQARTQLHKASQRKEESRYMSLSLPHFWHVYKKRLMTISFCTRGKNQGVARMCCMQEQIS
jgi:hypothetical protein